MKWSEFFSRRRGEIKPAHEQIRLGNEAKALLDSPAYHRAMDRLRVQIHEGWAAAPVEDVEGQQRLRLLLSLLDALERSIKDESDNGLIAREQEKQDRAKEQAKRK